MSADDLHEWEKLALAGNFSKLPRPFPWRASARLAHFLNGYREAGGFDELTRLALAKSKAARETGHWSGSAYELWLCLFFEHRAARRTGSDPDHGDQLCEALRSALQALSPGEARNLAERLPSPYRPTTGCPA